MNSKLFCQKKIILSKKNFNEKMDTNMEKKMLLKMAEIYIIHIK